MLVISILTDIGLCTLSFFIILRAINAKSQECKAKEVRISLITVGSVLFLRVSHVVLMFLYLVCCASCVICPDGCCIKNLLLRGTKPSMHLIKELENWSWIYQPPPQSDK